MNAAEIYRQRRRHLWLDWSQTTRTRPVARQLCLSDPIHLAYLCGFWVDPISLGAGFGGLLQFGEDGAGRLLHDNRLPASVAEAEVEERLVIDWYDGQTPGRGPRELVLAGMEVHDGLFHPEAPTLARILARHRRAKDELERSILARCMRATEAGHAWARANVRPGMTELDVYAGIVAACQRAAGMAAIVYGDFAVSPGTARRGGPATPRPIEPGEMLILDFSVVIAGYRSDFTNTLVVGREPTADQRRLYEWCVAAMAAGERVARAGVECQAVYDAVRGVFEAAGVAEAFPHHAGHGLGLTHPEAPFLVRRSTERLEADDIITLEPGLYIDGVGGIRIENNYRVCENGLERMSHHAIVLQ